MLSPELTALLAQADRIQRLVWWALSLAILVYAGAGFAAAGAVAGGAGASGAGETLRPVLYAAAVANGILSLVLYRRARAPERLRAHLTAPIAPEVLAQDPRVGGSPASPILDRVRRLSDSERRVLALVPRTFMPWVLCMVLNEAVAIFGLVLALLAGNRLDVLPFAAAALALNAAMFPNNAKLAERALGFTGV